MYQAILMAREDSRISNKTDGAPSEPNAESASALPSQISESSLLLFAVASAIVTANAYYIHPIISSVARYYGVSDALIGMVPSFNQMALALGIFLLLPLGDRFSNRKLTLIFVSLQVLALGVMAMADSYILFVAGSTALGFVTVAPYLLPAYVSKRVVNSRLGHANAILTTGIIFGILVARAGAGVIGEYVGWRMVYVIATGLMLVVSVLLYLIMEERKEPRDPKSQTGYFSLILSVFPIARAYPEILIAGAIQGLGFGAFLAIWMGLGLHLTSPEMGYGTDTVGYLAALTIFNLFITPRLGRWADGKGPRKARLIFAAIHTTGSSLLLFTGHSLWLLIIPLFLINSVGPTIDVSNRMTFLNQPPDVRTRLMTIYIVCMFVGGGIASWAGTAVYHFAGWTGSAILSLAFSSLVLLLSFLSYRWKGH